LRRMLERLEFTPVREERGCAPLVAHARAFPDSGGQVTATRTHPPSSWSNVVTSLTACPS
jgi:hypothetical protein